MKIFRKCVKADVSIYLEQSLCNSLLNFDHRNLVKVLNYQISEGEFFRFDLEYCEFKSLREILDMRKVDIEFVNSLIEDVLNGLLYLHGKGFVHGDIKLSNILLGRDGEALVFKLGDLDTIRPNPSEFSKAGFYTPEILAPECYSIGRMDEKVDIWSFGVLLFKVFTGEYPFGHREIYNFEQILTFVKIGKYQNYKPNDLPNPYCTLVEYCLIKDPDLRPSAADLLNLLSFPE